MIKTETINDITIASFVDITKINAIVSESVKEELKKLYTNPGTKLILDLNEISFIDSSGFGIFLSLMKAARNNQGHFKICNIKKGVLEIFIILQLHNVFEIFNTREEALKSFM